MTKNPFDREKKEFIGILAHELRNPLATILSSVELLRLQEVYAPGTALLLQTVEERVHAITSILDNLLDLPSLSRAAIASFPLSAHAPALHKSESRGGRVSHHSKHARTILVVDDNELAAEALGRLLELRGHEVTTAYSGSEAIEKAKQFRQQIIILDIGLPDMDGYEVVRILRKEKKYSPTLIALTGYGQTEDKERALKAGFHLHLTKPVALKEVEEAFQKMPHAL